ncbi:hypothetical protein [Micromonospora sp. WMMD1082]|uniref:hypothetical protein n=1 Tax=Micromonospora sp. WMMD1082 TaxID=3016104 RepID=UPI002415E7A6|nr:hypothetical protein [Micromonospora sp. WMMD1082]MDG4796195.1 hypothetical protein [Micromonospora sp. WMMD1082]
MNPTVEIIAITPAMAEQWLGKNLHNRNVRPRVVELYARDMAAGAWELNGEAIKFAVDGTLLDGQHRLHAIVKAASTVPALVIRGLPRETQTTMDTGAKRTSGDALALLGENHAKTLASVARRVTMWDRYDRKDYATQGSIATNAELITTIERYPDMRASAEFADQYRKTISLAAAPLGFCHWALCGISVDHADVFFHGLATGADLGRRNPVLVLRERLKEELLSSSRTPERGLVAMVFKSWNDSRVGKERGLIRFSSTESFPIPK